MNHSVVGACCIVGNFSICFDCLFTYHFFILSSVFLLLNYYCCCVMVLLLGWYFAFRCSFGWCLCNNCNTYKIKMQLTGTTIVHRCLCLFVLIAFFVIKMLVFVSVGLFFVIVVLHVCSHVMQLLFLFFFFFFVLDLCAWYFVVLSWFMCFSI